MEILIDSDRIQSRLDELARQIAADYAGRSVTIIGVLTGSLTFLADLVRRLGFPLQLGLIQASSYRGPNTTPGPLEIRPEHLPDVRDRHILLLDDILDTGQTLHHVISYLRDQQVASLRVAVLLRKRGRQRFAVEPDYCGFEIPDVFVVGYGLDYNDDFRYLPHVAVYSADSGSPGEVPPSP
jgi:hypoxanthine phosphoribosyltransferase